MFSQSNHFHTRAAVLAIFIAMIAITAGAAMAKSTFSILSPENVTVLRLSISAIILFFALRVWQVRVERKGLCVVLAYGVAVAAMNLFFYLAIKTVPVGVALAIELTGPLCVAVLYSQHRADYLWVLLAVLGIYFLLPSSSHTDGLDTLGVIYALIAAFFWGCYLLLGKKAGEHYGSKAPALGLIFASVLVAPFADNIPYAVFDIELVLLVVVVALLSSSVPLIFEMFALRNLPTKTYGILTSGEPVIGAVVSLIILGEQLTFLQCLGIGTIVIASVGTLRSPHLSQRKGVTGRCAQ